MIICTYSVGNVEFHVTNEDLVVVETKNNGFVVTGWNHYRAWSAAKEYANEHLQAPVL